MRSAVAAVGVGFGEGPVWRPSLGDLIVTSISEGALFRVDGAAGTIGHWADRARGPNGALLIEGDGILVAQNGGLDVSRFRPGPVPPVRPTTAGLQLVDADGSVRATAPFSPSSRCPRQAIP
jgi:sugar lactone lactonase YvrE